MGFVVLLESRLSRKHLEVYLFSCMLVQLTYRFPETELKFGIRILVLNFVEIWLYLQKSVHFVYPV